MSSYKRTTLFLVVLVAVIILGVSRRVQAGISTDVYAVQTNLMQYKGYQNDISATVYAQYADYQLLPFIRYVLTNYYYLIENGPNSNYTSDRRTAAGGGLDYKINNYFKLRYIVELIDNKLTKTNYQQESYGLIYNQYINSEYLEFNNYLESFLIPRVARSKLDTFARIQAMKTFYLSQSSAASNLLYPTIQIKAKFNDDANFGLSGQNASVGAGYKFYSLSAAKDSFAFVLEAHSVFFQSRDFKGDWFQVLAALQIGIN